MDIEIVGEPLEKATKEQMHEEALNRMRILGMPQNCIDAFEKGTVTVVEPASFTDGYYCAPCDEDRQPIHFVVEKMQESDAENGEIARLVYAVLKDYQSFGEIFTGLYVSQYMSDWEIERDGLETAMIGSPDPNRRWANAITWTFPGSATFIEDGYKDFGEVTLDVSRGFPVRVG